jgi:hypothetical protein
MNTLGTLILTWNLVPLKKIIIWEWWFNFKAMSPFDMLVMDCWLGWLHYRYKQWGQWMQKDMTPNEITSMPTTNFNKVVHAF